MYEYAISLGVKFTFGARVSEYFETERSTGIIINGQKHVGDFVIGTGGVHSRARNFVTKKEEKPQKSVFAVFRSWSKLDSLLVNPKTEWIAKVTERSNTRIDWT
jgi:2-polyprenyl-6-methoxyphenol hydroxylase-like FAD-dependent oxidoreductase